MNIIRQLWNYGKLAYQLNSLHKEYSRYGSIDTQSCHQLIDKIHKQILNCGAICIKFAQWLLPILDNIYIEEKDKPYWFTSLEELYENCPIHSTEYSKEIYMSEFGQNFDDNYTIVDVIGSGSIGQVYKIKHKYTGEHYAFKIIHPKVKQELKLFKKLLKVMLWFPCIQKKLHNLVPVNYVQFIDNFEEQISMIHESNNLLQMEYAYKQNPSVIIPKLIRCSESCLIMSYESGEIMDKMELSHYQRTKVITLLYGFIMSNQMFYDLLHNDIHKANWKVRQIDENKFAIVVYDFGFCYRKEPRDRPIITMMTDMFEAADVDKATEDGADKYSKMMCFFCGDYSDHFREQTKEFIPDGIACDPNALFKLGIVVCDKTGATLNANTIQILIVSIQCYKYLKDANINNANKLKNDGYRTYREKFLDLCNIYTTYDSFDEFVDYMRTKLNKLDIPVDNLFDVIDDNDTVTDELKSLLKFD